MESFTNKDKNKSKIMFSLILGQLGFFFFFFFLSQSIHRGGAKNFNFQHFKKLLYLFYHPLYNTLYIKCSIFFLSLILKYYKQLIKIIKEVREFEFFNLRKKHNLNKILYFMRQRVTSHCFASALFNCFCCFHFSICFSSWFNSLEFMLFNAS